MSIIGYIIRFIILRVNKKLGQYLLSNVSQQMRNFQTTIKYCGVNISVFTGETMGRRIFYYDDFESKEINVFNSLLRSDYLFFDIGANIGLFSLLAAKKQTKIYAFEPSPAIYNKLNENIILNNYQKYITTIQAAIADKKGVLEFAEPRRNNHGVGRILNNSSSSDEDRKVIKVEANTLDNYVEKYGMPNLIKMDIEGAEVLAIKGAEKMLKNEKSPILIIEVHDNLCPSFGSSKDDFIKNVENFGFLKKEILYPNSSNINSWIIFYKPFYADVINSNTNIQ